MEAERINVWDLPYFGIAGVVVLVIAGVGSVLGA